MLVAGGSTEPLPSLQHNEVLRLHDQEAFVHPDISRKKDAVLISIQNEKDLLQPISSGIVRVLVVQGGAKEALILKKVDEELYPF